MKTFTSTAKINRPINDVYLFLADLENHEQLMPENVENWSSTPDEASFNIKNMGKLSLKVKSRTEDEEIIIVPAEKPPFDLELKWNLSSNNDQTDAVFTITADLNMMMKMVASGPLQKLANHETQSITAILN